MHKQEFSTDKLRHWFEENKRNFPWRENPSPYRVWVSEVMLQQTQASVVIPYFERWMERFPDVETLAKASEDEVIKLWEGLGYYSRARSLLSGARYLVAHHKGKMPEEAEALARLKGIGPYTVGAIRSFAFHKKNAAVDGNVSRVASRLLCLEEEIDRLSTQKILYQKVEDLLPDTEPWVIMEALIELGARICKKKPLCSQCPLVEDCLAYQLGKVDELPKKRKLPQITLLEREVLVVHHERDFLVQKQQGKKVMSGLHEFPYCSKGETLELFPFQKELKAYRSMAEVCHTFTRYKARLFPSLWQVEEKFEVPGYFWVRGTELMDLSFSSGHRQILKQILEEYAHLTY